MLLGRTLGFYFSRQFVKTIFVVFATVFFSSTPSISWNS